MNYVICLCKVNGENILLDATEKFAAPNILPTRCLNGEGRVISAEKSDWIPLLSGNKMITATKYDLTLNDDAVLMGSINKTDREFAAFSKRNSIDEFESTQKYIDDIVEDNPGLTINDFSFQNLDSINNDLNSTYAVQIKEQVEKMGDLIFFKPLFYDASEKNPFTLVEREHPVEFPYPIIESVESQIELPQEYTIESVPENFDLSILDGKANFKFFINIDNNLIKVNTNLQINKTIFPSNEYDQLKVLYELMIKKQQEKIVLKKNN